MRRALVLLLLASCRQVFGLDSPELLDAPADSTPPPEVTGSLVLHYMVNDPAGVPSVTEKKFAASEVTLRVTQDGATKNVDLHADGSFSFPRTSAMYSLEVATPYRTLTYQVAADHLDLVARYLGRPGMTPPPAGTQLGLSFTNRPMNMSEFLVSTGVYSATPLAAGATAFDWTTAGWLADPGLLDANQHDRLSYLAYTPTAAYTASLTHFATTETLTVAGSTTGVNFGVMPVAANKCIKEVAAAATELTRLRTARPGFVTSSVAVTVRAMPAPEMFTGFVLVTDQTGATPMDLSKTQMYANPFSMGTTAVLTALLSRVVGATTLLEHTQLWVPTDGTCGADVQLPAGMVAIPTSFRLAGVELVDDTRFTLPTTSSVELGWTVTSERADTFTVDILDVGSQSPTYVATYVTTDPRLELDPAVLERGHDYVFNVTVVRGQPNAAIGDFRTYEPEVAFSNGVSPLVHVE